MVQIVKVQFATGDSHMKANAADQKLSSREYDYFHVGEEIEVKKGQFAVVAVSGILKIVKVVGVGKYSNKAHSYIITVFDLESHEARIDKHKRIEDLHEAILARAASAKKRKELNELAESDEGLKKMLEDLDKLREDTA